MRRIGIYGGTFNPLHNGHLALAKAFLSQENLDEVWFMVSPQNPFKANQKLLDDAIRLEMVQKALEGEQNLFASDYEFHLSKPSYTWNTLQAMSKDYPDCEFVLLIGGDNWKSFSHWYHSDDILRNYSMAVYPRENSDIDVAMLPANVHLLATMLISISSTEVRRKVAQGEPIDSLCPPQVVEIIRNKGLYRN